ncbi:MAG: hypothetical protein QX199_18370 [Methylococcaceae bacterium]
MKITQWFMKKQLWVRGGIIGMAVCMGLFVFYGFYFSMIHQFVYSHEGDFEMPSSELILPMVTGHAAVSIATFFMIEGSSIPAMFCKETETHCVSWTVLPDQGGVPWKDLETGADGYCIQQETTPKTSCVDRVQNGAFLMSILLLEGLYFAIGAGIGFGVQWRRNRMTR